MLKCEVHELRESRDSVTSHCQSLEEEVAALLGNMDKLEQECAERDKMNQERWVLCVRSWLFSVSFI